jgi:L-ascorbate metabolism protein UlaG (beta-lactamase superfamily)
LSYEYPTAVRRFTHLDLPERIDYAILSHSHNDHFDFETLVRLRHRIGCLVVPSTGGGRVYDPSFKLMLRQIGFRNVAALDELEAIEFEGGGIVALPFLGEHCDLDIQTKRGYLVRAAGSSIFCGADSCNLEPQLYHHLHELYGDVDLVFLGMECEGAPLSWTYGSLLTQPLERRMDMSRTFSASNADQGLAIIDALKPKQAYVYAMGQEPWLNHVMGLQFDPTSKRVTEPVRFIAGCRARGITAAQPHGKMELNLPRRP